MVVYNLFRLFDIKLSVAKDFRRQLLELRGFFGGIISVVMRFFNGIICC